MQLIEELVAAWYSDCGLAERVNRAGADVVTQVDAAVAALPAVLSGADADKPRVEAVEAWFAEQLRRAPLSYDTDLYNHVAAAVEQLKARLATD